MKISISPHPKANIKQNAETFHFSTLEEFAEILIHPAVEETSGGGPGGLSGSKKPFNKKKKAYVQGSR